LARPSIERLPRKWPGENWQKTWIPAVRAGDVLYVSGIASKDNDGTPVGIGDFGAQATRCLERLEDVLERAGGTLSDVVKLTTYLTPGVSAEAVKLYFDIRAQFFGEAGPASTGVTVHSLARPEYLIEIDAIAHLQDG
jgi:enamine deaminase RidA (YjgF/YER057c/UK114 family)